jgi:hypothetical protein
MGLLLTHSLGLHEIVFPGALELRGVELAKVIIVLMRLGKLVVFGVGPVILGRLVGKLGVICHELLVAARVLDGA